MQDSFYKEGVIKRFTSIINVIYPPITIACFYFFNQKVLIHTSINSIIAFLIFQEQINNYEVTYQSHSSYWISSSRGVTLPAENVLSKLPLNSPITITICLSLSADIFHSQIKLNTFPSAYVIPISIVVIYSIITISHL